MTLSFTQTIKGKPNYFIEKIWESIIHLPGYDYATYIQEYIQKFGKNWDGVDWDRCWHEPVNSKPHTIREDKSNRWRAGMKIHPVINNRTAKRFQFAPELECKSVQAIEIKYTVSSSGNTPLIVVSIESKKTEGYMLCFDTYNPNLKKSAFGNIEKLAINDGFDSVEDFFAYFNKDFTGKLIHWTNLKY